MNSVTRTINGYVYTFAKIVADAKGNVAMASKEEHYSTRKLGERAVKRIQGELDCNTLLGVTEVSETRTMPIETFIANSTVSGAEE